MATIQQGKEVAKTTEHTMTVTTRMTIVSGSNLAQKEARRSAVRSKKVPVIGCETILASD